MNLHELELFLNLSRTLHFGKTSQAGHISPSALSRVVQRLEDQVGQDLFIRDNRTVQLSPIGAKFQRFAQETIDKWEHFQDSVMQEGKVLRGELMLYSSVTAASWVLSDLFARFRTLHPLIHIRLVTGDAAYSIERVQNGSADITVAAKPDSLPKTLRFKTITTTPLVFIGPVVQCDVTQMISGPNIPWERVPLILAEQALSRRRVEAWFREKSVRPNIYAEVAGHEAILSMVRLGCGIGVVPELVIDNSIFNNEIRRLGVTPGLEAYEVGLCAHKRRLTAPIVRAFWQSVK